MHGPNGASISQHDSAKRIKSVNAIETGESDQRQESGEVDETAPRVRTKSATQFNSNDAMEVEQGLEPQSATTETFAQENGKRGSICAFTP